jgi:predicted DCC family thiol-disulfide oxidoreductase YuxK
MNEEVHTDGPDVLVVYDGQCPACDHYAHLVRIRESAGRLVLVDAREAGTIGDEIAQHGGDLDRGMAVKVGTQWYFAADAVHALARLGASRGFVGRLAFWVFRWQPAARMLYPALRLVRDLLLRARGAPHIHRRAPGVTTKRILPFLLMPAAILTAGCATHDLPRPPGEEERAVLAMRALYEESRVLVATNGVRRYAFVPDPGVVHAAEAMLLHYARSESPAVRGAAACRLAHFGTAAARRRRLTLTVRQSIAEALTWTSDGSPRLRKAFMEFARDENKAIREPARRMVEAWSSGGGRY